MPGSGQVGDPAAYSVVLPVRGLAKLQTEVLAMATLLDLDGAPAQAASIRKAYFELLDELKAIGREIAAIAQDEILNAEVSSRVRPDTGGDGGPRLENYLGVSHPLDAVEGSVGINYEPTLYENVPWWWTNEEGYSGHIGRVVHGYFYDTGFTSAAAPNPSRFREHPLFRAEGKQATFNFYGDPLRATGKGVRPAMTIENPIPERRFVLHGAQAAEVAWHLRVGAARARFHKEYERAIALAPPPPPGPARRR